LRIDKLLQNFLELQLIHRVKLTATDKNSKNHQKGDITGTRYHNTRMSAFRLIAAQWLKW